MQIAPSLSPIRSFRRLLNERKAIEQKIESLRLDKNLLPEAEYEKRLEDFVLQLARKNQEIQEQQKK